ncbi:MAG TPA: DUF2157 domain-containing protein [Oscillatoriaceae cyanobacterium M33_DOE_052]|uniref:DUF2157 domain-containing protein n=1 Tax=Planktothricoides sp. SpSt-374 TaxID=2282167 RepID=A0A7C3ZTB5_9CYAN|nr:DUF2157 domain-containing protein [Oscillatoriaceae cyanobacterium M33_DOE_052]
MVSEKFRRQLIKESQKWLAEGLLATEQYDQLWLRYKLGELEAAASNRFIAILIGLGCILLGLGVVVFVAANWQVWPRSFKASLLLVLFVVANTAGFYLWQGRGRYRQKRLGQGLLVLGALILGANMALMSQMFHQVGALSELFLAWGIGVLVMAYSLRLTALGIMAVILVIMGYWQAIPSWLYLTDFSWSQQMVQHMPLVLGGLFVPLAHWCRSRVLFGLTTVAIASAIVNNSLLVSLWADLLWMMPLGLTLTPAILWVYNEETWKLKLPHQTLAPDGATNTAAPSVLSSPEPEFRPLARTLALWFLSIFFYSLSFHWFWQDAPANANLEGLDWRLWPPVIDILIFTGLAVLGWLELLRTQPWRIQLHLGDKSNPEVKDAASPTPNSSFFNQKALNSGIVAGLMAIAALSMFWHLNFYPLPIVGTFAFNVVLFVLAVGLIRDGLAVDGRFTFWGGMVLLVLGIISRMLEYDTDLLLKSLVFVICGVGVIAAGLWFERQKVRLRARSSNSPNLEEEEKQA